jgi:hypothetical protein
MPHVVCMFLLDSVVQTMLGPSVKVTSSFCIRLMWQIASVLKVVEERITE